MHRVPRHADDDVVKAGHLRRAVAELDLVRRRRELFFWTITMSLTVIVLISMVIAFLLSLIQGGR